MRARYSIWTLLRNAAGGHLGWPRVWRDPEPKKSYDAVIIGGGGHGLATAYYLAKDHGITDVAVVEKGWIGGGNVGRNTGVIRSNYLREESAAIYETSLKMWEGLSQELNFNLMVSQRGMLTLAHSRAELHDFALRSNAMRLNGIESEILTPADLKAVLPILDLDTNGRHPVLGAFFQRRAGTVRHDAVAWAYARAADALGVDIVHNCEITGIRHENGRVGAVETSRGTIRTAKVGVAAAAHSSVVAGLAGVRIPILTRPLHAFVSEPLKPILDYVVGSGVVATYLSQSDKGELVLGTGLDPFQSYASRSNLAPVETSIAAAVHLFPIFSRLRLMRQWAGNCDVTPDFSPILSKTPLTGFYINCGWGTGGFKATPVAGRVFAHTIAMDHPHPLSERFALERFSSGDMIEELASAGAAH